MATSASTSAARASARRACAAARLANARLNPLYSAIAAPFAGIAAQLKVFVFYSPACRSFG